MSSADRPAASKPMIVPTVTRKPRIQGLPPIPSRLKLMRLRFGIIAHLRCSTLHPSLLYSLLPPCVCFSRSPSDFPRAGHWRLFSSRFPGGGGVALAVADEIRPPHPPQGL